MQILGYGSRDAYLESKTTIEAKAKDMVAHYVKYVFPNGYKAQIVATSREAAVRYKLYVDAALSETVAALEQDNPQKLDVAQHVPIHGRDGTNEEFLKIVGKTTVKGD